MTGLHEKNARYSFPATGAHAEPDWDAPMPKEKRGSSVLLIEDEALISLDLGETLHDAGYEVIGPAKTATDALALLQGRRPDVAITDLLLRDGSCTHLLRQLQYQGVPFLVYTGYRQTDDLVAFCPAQPGLRSLGP